jgi:hypothetical protein
MTDDIVERKENFCVLLTLRSEGETVTHNTPTESTLNYVARVVPSLVVVLSG